jgi:hypothetical protein
MRVLTCYILMVSTLVEHKESSDYYRFINISGITQRKNLINLKFIFDNKSEK